MNHDRRTTNQSNQANVFVARTDMNLSKWQTNASELDRKCTPDDKDVIEPLGVQSTLSKDCISVTEVKQVPQEIKTKREITAVLSSIFEPLGIVLPYDVSYKLLTRTTWLMDIGWDAPLPDDIKKQANELLNSIHLITRPAIPRWSGANDSKVTLHAFTVASEKALDTVFYITSSQQPNPTFAQAVNKQAFFRNKQLVHWYYQTPLSPKKGVIFEQLIRNAGRPLNALPLVGGAALKGFRAELMDNARHQNRVRSAEIKTEEDGNEKLVTRSTERMVPLQAADEYLPGLADSEARGGVCCNPNTAMTSSQDGVAPLH